MGAVVVSAVNHQGVDPHGNRVVDATITLSASYATGGDTLAGPMATSLGLRSVYEMHIHGGSTSDSPVPNGIKSSVPSNTANHVVLAGTSAAPLIQAYTSNAQVANATNLTTWSKRVRFVGI